MQGLRLNAKFDRAFLPVPTYVLDVTAKSYWLHIKKEVANTICMPSSQIVKLSIKFPSNGLRHQTSRRIFTFLILFYFLPNPISFPRLFLNILK